MTFLIFSHFHPTVNQLKYVWSPYIWTIKIHKCHIFVIFSKKILLDYLVCSTTSTTYIHFQHNNTVHLTVFPWIQAVLFQVKISKSETIFSNVMQKVQRVSYLIWKKVLIWKAEFWDFFFTHSPRQMCWLITYTVKMKGCETENLMFLLKIFFKKII